MAHDLIKRYVWLVDKLREHGSLSLKEIQDLWIKERVGGKLTRRTFFHYRNTIEEAFDINIECNLTTYEYYIAESSNSELDNWLIDTLSVSEALREASDLRERIVMEPIIPSRELLPPIIIAMRKLHPLQFHYRSYTAADAGKSVKLNPYFVKYFKQVWYVIGLDTRSGKVKTYALDRMRNLQIVERETFRLPKDISAAEYFKDSFGIIRGDETPEHIVIRANATQAKYLRATPLHHSQEERIGDGYSLFSYRMRITYDLTQALLSYGANIEVLEPASLRDALSDILRRALTHYPSP